MEGHPGPRGPPHNGVQVRSDLFDWRELRRFRHFHVAHPFSLDKLVKNGKTTSNPLPKSLVRS